MTQAKHRGVHQPTPRAKQPRQRTKPPTRAQRQAAAMLEEIEREAKGLPPRRRPAGKGSVGAKPLSARKRVLKRVPRKYKTTRGLIHITFGAATVLRVAGKGVYKGGAVVGRAGVRQAKTSAAKRTWHSPVAGTRWRPGQTIVTCVFCGDHFTSAQAGNEHYEEVHANEAPVERKPRPQPAIKRGATARTAGMRIVHPGGLTDRHPQGRHRAVKHRVPALTLIKQYQADVTRRGEMAESKAIHQITLGFKGLSDELPPVGRPTLDTLVDILSGLERVGSLAPDEIADFERELVKRDVDPAAIRMGLLRVREGLQMVASGATLTLAEFTELYKDEIAAARRSRGRSTPQREFFQAG